MAERLKAHAWNACISERVSWVRIPLSPNGVLWAGQRGDVNPARSGRKPRQRTFACVPAVFLSSIASQNRRLFQLVDRREAGRPQLGNRARSTPHGTTEPSIPP